MSQAASPDEICREWTAPAAGRPFRRHPYLHSQRVSFVLPAPLGAFRYSTNYQGAQVRRFPVEPGRKLAEAAAVRLATGASSSRMAPALVSAPRFGRDDDQLRRANVDPPIRAVVEARIATGQSYDAAIQWSEPPTSSSARSAIRVGCTPPTAIVGRYRSAFSGLAQPHRDFGQMKFGHSSQLADRSGFRPAERRPGRRYQAGCEAHRVRDHGENL